MKVGDLRNIIQSASTGAEIDFDLDGDYVRLKNIVVTETAGGQHVTFVLTIPEGRKS